MKNFNNKKVESMRYLALENTVVMVYRRGKMVFVKLFRVKQT